MESMEKYINKQSLVEFDSLFDTSTEERNPGPNLFTILLKRWKMVLLIFCIVSAAGIPIIWFTVKPFYMATAAIRVSPVISSILSGGQQGLPMYRSFTSTQAELITSDKMLQKVAEDLADKGVIFHRDAKSLFEVIKSEGQLPQTVDTVSSLRSAVLGKKLIVSSDGDTELIKIAMKGDDPEKTAEIANAFVRVYMTVAASDEIKSSELQMATLEKERKSLEDEIKTHNASLYDLAQQYGTSTLTGRQEIIMNRVAKLQEKLTEFEMDKIALQVKINLLQNKKVKADVPKNPEKLHSDFVNADPVVQALSENVAKLEQELVVAREQMVSTNPKLIRKEAVLDALKQRLEERRKEAAVSQVQESNIDEKESQHADSEKLHQLTVTEKQIRDLLAKEDANNIELGRKQLAIQDAQSRLNLSRELHDTVQRRIKELEIENKQPARISVAYYANTVPYQDNRKKYSMVLGMFAMMCGMGLSLLRDKFDLSVKTPQDMIKHVDVRILGTTTSGKTINKSLRPRSSMRTIRQFVLTSD